MLSPLFAKAVVVLVLVCLTTPISCSRLVRGPSETAEDSQLGRRYKHRLFLIELTNVEAFDNEIKLTFMYTNRTDKLQHGGPVVPSVRAYLVDNLGNRYPYASDSIEKREWPPEIPIEVSMTFAKTKPGASNVTLILPWAAWGSDIVQSPRRNPSDEGQATIMFRRVALPTSSAAATGYRYSHRLFKLEFKNVEVVGDELRINMTYTNLSDGPQRATVAQTNTYLIDNRGKRYTYSSDSFTRLRREFPPRAPEEIWISFGKLQPGSSSVSLILPWRVRDAAPVDVTWRDIPLPQ